MDRKKILRYTWRTLAILAGVIVLLYAVIYLPPVQRFIKKEAIAYVSRTFDVQLSVEQLRLRFPLKLRLGETLVMDRQNDTLIYCRQLDASVALLPLLRSDVVVRGFDLDRAVFHFNDTVTGMDLRGAVRHLYMRSREIDLRDKLADLSDFSLSGGTVNITMSRPHPEAVPDTAARNPLIWRIEAGSLLLDSIDFRLTTWPDSEHLTAWFEQANISTAKVDLGNQIADIRRINIKRGDFAYLADPPHTAAGVAEQIVSDSTATDSPKPWTVSIGAVRLDDNSLRYGLAYGTPAPGLDPNHLELTGLNLSVDSIYNKGAQVKVLLRDLRFRERSGLEVTGASGNIRLDSVYYEVDNFRLTTPTSSLQANAVVGEGIAEMDPVTPVRATLAASLSSTDLFLISPPGDTLRRALGGETFTLQADASGTLDNLNLSRFQLNAPDILTLSASGTVRSLSTPENLGGTLELRGNLTGPDRLTALLTGSATGNRFRLIPMQLRGNVSATAGQYTAALHLNAGEGTVDLNGNFNTRSQAYRARLAVDSLPVYRFAQSDSLGYLTLGLEARGRGFDIYSPSTASDIDLHIARADYMGYDFRNIDLDAEYASNRLTATLHSDNDALRADLDIEGELTRDLQQVSVGGRVRTFDLEVANLSPTPVAASFTVALTGSAARGPAYVIDATLDSMRLRYGNQATFITRTHVGAVADTSHVEATVTSGDMNLAFNSPVPVDSLTARLGRTASALKEQIARLDLRPDSLSGVLPPFRLDLTAKKNNILHDYMQTRGIGFGNLTVVAAAADTASPFRLNAEVNQFTTGDLRLDTVNVGGRINGDRLQYYARVANRPGNLNRVGFLAATGNLSRNEATVNVRQRSRQGNPGLNFGLEATLSDSSVRVHMTPERPVFGFATWSVNPDNYFVYHYDKEMEADLSLTRPGQEFTLRSASQSDMPQGSVRLILSGIDIGNALRIFPTAPEIDGVLSSNLIVGLSGGVTAAQGELGVDSLTFDSRSVGDLGLQLSFRDDTLSTGNGHFVLSLDDRTAVTADVTLPGRDSTGMRLAADIPGLPLAVANAFLPEDTAELEGTLSGQITATGPTNDLNLNGNLAFSGTTVDVEMIGTTFRLSDNTITIADNLLILNNFSLIAPNNQPLTLSGQVDIGDFSDPQTDLTVTASNFQLVNVDRSAGSPIFGNASIDLDATARGALNSLTVRGDLRLLSGSSITYVMQDSPDNARNTTQNIVTFVAFDDTLSTLPGRVPSSLESGMDILVNVGIDDNVKAAVYLTEDGQSRINVEGDGDLTFSLNRQGDARLAGRYDINDGTVRYNPPVVQAIDFDITEGSYVQWSGPVAEPTFQITATESVAANVTSGNDNRNVNFNITVSVGGSLDQLSLTFDLAAPQDITLQNELSSMTAEERSNQAIGLLVYNRYTGPGSTATATSANPLNAFITNELNQWAADNLKGVDLSFGIDTQDGQLLGTGGTDYSYQVAKNLGNRVRVVVGGRYDTSADSDDVAENLVDDISIEYMFSRRDNMYFKLFRHNNFESILEGEVVETGVGFVVQKKILKLGDLFRRTPERRMMRDVRRGIADQEKQMALDTLNRKAGDMPSDSLPADSSALRTPPPGRSTMPEETVLTQNRHIRREETPGVLWALPARDEEEEETKD